jgi:stage V sporulation protein G
VEITDVRVFPVEDDKLKAFVSIVFDRCFMVNDIRVIRGREGLFISMPSRKKPNGEFKDVAHPLNQETRSFVEARVLAAYREAVGEPAGESLRQAHGSGAEPAGTGEGAEQGRKSLEEIEKLHLRDSFWGVG